MKMLPIQALALMLPLSFAVQAQVQAHSVAAAPIAQLKASYLQCAEVTSNAVMDPGTAAQCSMVADALRDRAFDGSFEQMLAWWHQQRRSKPEAIAEDSGRSTSAPVR